MLLEKEIFDSGNQKAKKWLIVSLSRLKTKSGKQDFLKGRKNFLNLKKHDEKLQS